MPTRRRRKATPTPAEIWRILRAIARDERIARRRDAREERIERQRDRALRRKFRREREARKRADAALERKYRDEQAERDRKLDERLNRIAGDGDNRWGQLIEALVGGDTVRLLRDAGVPVESLHQRIRSRNREGVWREYDLVAVGESHTVVVEVKTTLTQADVKQFTERIADFRAWRPDYVRPRIYGALGYLTARDDATRAAEAAGFYLIRAVGSSASIVNSEGFEPRPF